MAKVEFKFDIDQIVITKLSERGIIHMAALDDHENKTYYVELKNGNGTWIKEELLIEG